VKDETLFLSDGEVALLVEEDGKLVETVLRGGESYRIRPFTKHRMTAGEQGCDIIEVSTPELDDVVRLEDRYGRA
jgi:D-lyxose ketol-isomerase